MTQKQAHINKAAEHEVNAERLQNEAFGLAIKGDYSRAYQTLGRAAAEWKRANFHRKVASVAEVAA